jgi:uncharacterized cupin superfamily protein
MTQVTIEKLTEDEMKARQIETWPIWTKEVSRFDWSYDSTEQCFIIEGELVVETPEGNYSIKPGDFVTFQKGLQCVWDIKKPVKKHYKFF